MLYLSRIAVLPLQLSLGQTDRIQPLYYSGFRGLYESQ
jgi:hypothetical protein